MPRRTIPEELDRHEIKNIVSSNVSFRCAGNRLVVRRRKVRNREDGLTTQDGWTFVGDLDEDAVIGHNRPPLQQPSVACEPF